MKGALYVEIDAKAAAWLRELIKRNLIAQGEVYEGSVEDLRPSDLDGYAQVHLFAGIGVWSYSLRLAGWPDDRPVWTASCPCQPFSSAGKGAGFDDERHLWPAVDWLVQQCQPECIFGEQVASKDAEPWLDLVQADMEGLGYAFGACAFPSAGIGAPHIRDRTYWVADTESDGGGAGLRNPRTGRGGVAFAGNGGSVRGVAVSDSWELYGVAELRGPKRDRQNTGRPESGGGTSARRDDGGLADNRDSGRREAGHDQPPAGHDGAERDRSVGGVVNALGDGRGASWDRDNGGGDGAQPNANGRNDWTGPTNGHWRDADWLFCRDGKWRPVEPGTFPLAHGAASRVGRLRGYGNAVNAEAAAAFIASYMEARA